MASPRILITGASGYVGGTVLSHFQNSSNAEIKNASLSVLVRKQEQADKYASQGVTPFLLAGLEDVEAVRQLASQFDIIVHTADSTDPAAAEALVYGLRDGAQKSDGSTKKHFIHLSGVSSLGDSPISRSPAISYEFSDKRDDLYSYMKWLENMKPYSQRTTDLKVVDAGEKADVKTYVVKAPLIYGRGTGLFNNKSVHIPMLIRGAIAAGRPEYIGQGTGIWDDVHVIDVAAFFEHSWKELAEGLAEAGLKKNILKSTETQSIGLAEAAGKYTGGSTHLAEIALASNSVTKADLALEMGWKSQKTEADFRQSLLDDFDLVASSS
ncbi:hypothetical protein EKO27_g11579 [Xylaria grammica]|uniref:NAD-dependent epimerase/dehydratase domain-containing protein n=1 Tax=Xylaria grammica TaxID=363999 RepID=A0A439CN16_9PEZI|nr:hypothetical protein EKO27_g11579 [Xylaria grammica]